METNATTPGDQLLWTAPLARRVALIGGIVSKVVMEVKGTGRHRIARVTRRLVRRVSRVGPLAATAVLAAGALTAPWYGSLAWHVPAGQSVTGITGE